MLTEFRNRAYAAAIRVLPASTAGRLLPGLVRQFRETGVTSIGDSTRRLLIAPVNSAGQGYAWARSAERLPDVAAANYTFRGADDVFAFPADHVIPAAALLGNARWRSAQRDAVFERFTHVIVESGTHLYESGGAVLPLVRRLQDRGIRVALLWHGSDIRLPSAHAQRELDSPFGRGYPDTGALEQIAEANRLLTAEAGVPVFVSTPDLLTDVPQAQWLPVVVDTSIWSTDLPVLRRERPVVVHAPSRAGLKGTQQIGAVARLLDAQGLIEYREVIGVPASSMPQLYAMADIVLDQFLLGSYGVAACEALAAGRIVVGHLSEDVRRVPKERTGHDMPIVESRAGDLEEVLRNVILQRERFAVHAALGPAFVSSVHDGAQSAEALRGFLDS